MSYGNFCSCGTKAHIPCSQIAIPQGHEELIPFCAVLQVLDWHRLILLTWARISGPAPPLGPRRMTASLLRGLTTASSGGGLEELPCVEPRKYVQEPECRTDLTQGLLEKQGPPVDGGSLEQEEVICSLLDMGFSDVHIKELLGVRRGAPPRQLLDVISELVLLGVHPEPVCAVLKKSPQLLKLPVMQVKKRSSYLRKLGLGEGTGADCVCGVEESEFGEAEPGRGGSGAFWGEGVWFWLEARRSDRRRGRCGGLGGGSRVVIGRQGLCLFTVGLRHPAWGWAQWSAQRPSYV